MKLYSSEIGHGASQATSNASFDPHYTTSRAAALGTTRPFQTATKRKPRRKAGANSHPSGERQRHQSAAETPIELNPYILVGAGQSFVSAFSALVASALVL